LALLAALHAQSTPTAPEDNPGSPVATDDPTENVFGLIPDDLSQKVIDLLLKVEFGVDPEVPEPGELPGAGDLIPGGGGDEGGGLGGGLV
jgi:hypothetical protein